jgi:hypothetical protein
MKDIRKFSKGSVLLGLFVVFSIIISVSLSFYKYYIKRDYLLYIKGLCDPLREKCFVHECESDDIRCSSLPDQKFYYKILMKKAYNVPSCTGGECSKVSCVPGEESCTIYYCSDDNLEKFDLSDTCTP